MMPMSFTVASAQLRGQPETPSFTFAGVHEPQRKRSSLTPSPAQSCVPKPHHPPPPEVFQPSCCMTAGSDFNSFATMKPRTSSWVRSMHLHMGLRPAAAYSSPSVTARSDSTLEVHCPQEDEALVCARTSSSVVRPLA